MGILWSSSDNPAVDSYWLFSLRTSDNVFTVDIYPDGMSLAKHETVEETCDVAGCGKPAERSINIKQAARADLKLRSNDLRSVHLCKEHYKDYKKQTKQDRELDQVY